MSQSESNCLTAGDYLDKTDIVHHSVEANFAFQRKRRERGMNGWDENHPIMGSAGGEPAPIISFFIGIITIIIALQRLPPVATNLFLFPRLGALGPS